MATFKSRFKELRLEKNLTLKEIGAVLGLTEANMSMYESGKREPKKIEDLIKIADYFGVTLDYLMGRTDDPNVKLYSTNVDGQDYTIGVNREYPNDLTPDEVKALILKLKEYRFDVEGLIDEIKNKK